METTTVTDPQSGEIICNNCGMVIAENIQDDARPEWRSFGFEHDNNNKSRTGNPLTLARHDMGLSTKLCYLKRLSPPCYAYLGKRSTNFVHVLVYNSLSYSGNSRQNSRFYP